MFLDETAARLLIALIIALILVLFGVIGLCYGIGCEFKDINRENKALRQYIAHNRNRKNKALRQYIAHNRSDGEQQHAEYRAEFERRMKQNTADPARHEKTL